MAVRLKAARRTQDLVCAALKKHQPRPTGGSECQATWNVETVEKLLLPRIQYILTTGVAAFDGLIGGFPFGRICEVFGMESCGKTNLVMRTAIRAQANHVYEITGRIHGAPILKRLDPKTFDITTLYIDNEGSLDDDKVYCDAEEDGKLVRLDALVADCDTVDMFFKMAQTTIDTCVEIQKTTKRLQFVVVVLDTVAATSTRDELTRAWGKRDYPRHAAEWRQGFRKMTREIRRANACIICTNQVSENMEAKNNGAHRPRSNNPLASDYSTFGGRALKYYSTHRVFMFASSMRYKMVPDAQFPDGFLVGFVSVKNRIRKPLREGRMALLFATDDDGLNGGFSGLFSRLESLIHLRHAEATKGEAQITFKFAKYGITPKTFDVQESLDEQDEKPSKKRGKAKKDPSISCRADWPEFYAAHKEDLDLLWASAISYAFTSEGQSKVEIPDIEAEGDDPILIEQEEEELNVTN